MMKAWGKDLSLMCISSTRQVIRQSTSKHWSDTNCMPWNLCVVLQNILRYLGNTTYNEQCILLFMKGMRCALPTAWPVSVVEFWLTTSCVGAALSSSSSGIFLFLLNFKPFAIF